MGIDRTLVAHFTTRKTPQRCHLARGKERLSAAARAWTQAPVADCSFGYKRSPASEFPDFP
jgi:hypothetical protein